MVRVRGAGADEVASGTITYVTWPARLHVVTGKGGVGKTTVAAALALGLAASGQRVLLVEVEGRQGLAQLFELEPLPYAERRLGEVDVDLRLLAVDAEEALLEYLDLFYKMGRAGRALRKLGAIDFATTVAPGLRDILLTGKVKEATTRTDDAGNRMYGAVVLDAPPTGRIGRFLNVTAEAAKLAKLGPIKSQSEGVAALLRSPMTSVHIVTLLEEMPVQETSDALTELSHLHIPVGKIIVNCVRPPLLAGVSRITQASIKRGLAEAGLSAQLAQGLHSEANAHLARLALEEQLRGELAHLNRPMIELPLLNEGVDLPGLHRLAGLLAG
ncbi:MAG TPA: ATPase [Micromonosporaceae bacterium]|nr:ATPase [Micromonosporaceae bacterium]HCU52288.1 ATPase [Micromonosporaceae bacterium]